MPRDWKLFERLVAAVHVLKEEGAAVAWNDHIAGRQFDVTVRFHRAFYQYLIVIECRDQASALSASDVDAFVTKARDAKADKAVIVTAVGYQRGAFEVAARHGIELFTLEQIPADWPRRVLQDVDTVLTHVHSVRLLPAGQQWWRSLPDDNAFLANVRFSVSGFPNKLTIGDIAAQSPKRSTWSSTSSEVRFRFAPGQCLVHLPDGTAQPIDGFRCDVRLLPLKGTLAVQMPPELRPMTVRYRNSVSGQSEDRDARDLPIGFDEHLQAGRFYRDVDGREYICEIVTSTDATFVLLGSHQHGQVLFCRFSFDLQHGAQYVEVADTTAKSRLQALHAEFLRAERDGNTREDIIPIPERGMAIFRSGADRGPKDS